MDTQLPLKDAIELVPGKVQGAADICGVSARAVYKWLNAERLPRTDYTGETDYASRLARASNGAFKADQILKPVTAA